VVEGDRGVQQTFSSAQLLRRGAQAPSRIDGPVAIGRQKGPGATNGRLSRR
jgi:hypothetical protein